MTEVASISQRIWDMKYRLKTADSQPVDKTISDTWRRIAKSLAENEKNPADWEQRFFEAMNDFRFLPAGRILSGAGSQRNVTLFNCFVMGDIADNMAGIFDSLKEAALTMQQGGGIGYDFSTLRPKGSAVRGVGADSSGPLSFMDVWDAMCRTIMSAGSRRGAMMAVMRCDHPDIEAFIEAKKEPGRLRMFNLSVLVTDALMKAIKEDADWELSFDGTTYKSLKARELWDKIMRATYAYAEPGVIFIDRINRLNPLSYCETIHATNPCVTGDAWVQTDGGPRQVRDLVGRPFGALINGKRHLSGSQGFFKTGTKPVVRLETREGYKLRLTADHLVLRAASKTRYSIIREWVKAGDLAQDDLIVLHDHRELSGWRGAHTEEEGYLIGLLIGDGTLKKDSAVLSVWAGQAVANGEDLPQPNSDIMNRASEALAAMPHRADFHGWVKVSGRNEFRVKSAALRDIAFSLEIEPKVKAITPAVERTSSDFYRGFMRGIFDADGSVQGSQEKGVSIRLAQSDLPRLEAIQRMLLRLGIASVIYRDRRPEGFRSLPDGKGGYKEYQCAADHELVISRENIAKFSDLIGFCDRDKQTRLESLLTSYKRRPNRERFLTGVASIKEDGVEDVFDVQIPGINAFDANGFYVHNCGEQPLPPYGACLLGSVNLARLVSDPFTDNARLDKQALEELTAVAVRMMDNVIDISRFPLPQQEHEAKSKRRIGLGVTGLADALIMCRARYGGGEAVRLTKAWMATIRRASYTASAGLAAEKGPFPLYDAGKYLGSEAIRSLDDDVRSLIADNGIRNALLTSIAPTGTISLLADNVSSGLEPVFSFIYSRSVAMPDGSRREEEVSDYAYRLFRRTFGEKMPLPGYFIDAQSLSPNDHLVMQAAVQTYVDSSISKTINVPENIDFEDFKDIYAQAYELGCKGCTTYRPNDVTGSVLHVKKTAKDEDQPELPLMSPKLAGSKAKATDGGGANIHHMFRPLDRPEALPGATYKVQWPESEHSIYITLNDLIDDNARRRPFEVFINSKNMEHYAWTVALTRMISAVFRRGGDVSFVVEELKAVFDPRGGHWVGGKYVPSLLAAIGGVIEQHMINIGFMAAAGALAEDEAARKPQMMTIAANGGGGAGNKASAIAPRFRPCPKCSLPSLIRQEGCDTCTSCGYSKCS